MKAGILLSISLASLAGLAQAQCLDTLYLKELTVYSMSLVNSKAKAAWTETKVDPWNEQDIRKASWPLSDVYKNSFQFSLRMAHPQTVYAICDQLKWSARRNVVVTDSSWQEAAPSYAMKFEKFVRYDSVSVNGFSKVGSTNFTFQGGGELFDGGWASNDNTFIIGVKSDTISFQASATAVALKSGFSDWTDIPLRYSYIYPARGASEAIIDAGLAEISPYVDSIGLKSYDSTKFDGVIYKYIFSRARPQAASIARGNYRAAFELRPIFGGKMEFNFAQPQSVSIISPSGRVVRRLDAARNVVWDLRDQAGVRVQPGVWFVQVQGLKTVPVVVR